MVELNLATPHPRARYFARNGLYWLGEWFARRRVASIFTVHRSIMESVLEVDSCIRGHHVYRSIWTPIIGEQLSCKREFENETDLYAEAMIRDRTTVVGHVRYLLLVLSFSWEETLVFASLVSFSLSEGTRMGMPPALAKNRYSAMSSGNPQITPSNITRELRDRVRALLSRLNIGGF